MRKLLVVMILGVVVSGCVSMTPHEQRQYKEITSTGLSCDEIKNPGAAAFLNILPGFGDFYLASGSGQGHMWAIGAIDLLLWPISVVWGVPQAAISADAINNKECVYFCTATIDGKKQMLARQGELETISRMDEEAKLKPKNVAQEILAETPASTTN